MTDKKPCPVCTYLKPYPKELILEVDNLIFSKSKHQHILDLLTKSKVLNSTQKPSKHYIEKHRTDCLINFKPIYRIDENVLIDDSSKILNKNKHLININLHRSLDDYKKMSVQEREKDHIERLSEIKYMATIIIHYQMLEGNKVVKGYIPKEDITALKQVEDVIQGLKTDDNVKDINVLEQDRIVDTLIADKKRQMKMSKISTF